ncbi:hypothetical protein CBR_g19502 [Chara braunii]|uniref:Uncharacterized protein n=1 Tax=Chara braunii TaxID=69332 RepID=A0A388KY55_CHABU|nr:hypothetical protein CBR_g19502 [Chara braunii]|eukprot:GBG74989.1 hypothetical protein CBR_g19502 [Chara braunii]
MEAPVGGPRCPCPVASAIPHTSLGGQYTSASVAGCIVVVPVCLGTADGGIAPTALVAGDGGARHTLSFAGCVVVVVAESALGFGAGAESVVAATVPVVEFARTGTVDVVGAAIVVAAALAAGDSVIGIVVAAVCGLRSGAVVNVVGGGGSVGDVDPLAVGFGASGLVVGASIVSASCVGVGVGPAGVRGFVDAPVALLLGVAPRPYLCPNTGNDPAELASCLFSRVEVAHVGHHGGMATASGWCTPGSAVGCSAEAAVGAFQLVVAAPPVAATAVAVRGSPLLSPPHLVPWVANGAVIWPVLALGCEVDLEGTLGPFAVAGSGSPIRSELCNCYCPPVA